MKGILISFEGIDGSGKSTQSKKLYHWLKGKKYPVVYLEEPGGSNLGAKIKKILLYSQEPIEKFSELLLFLAARNQLVKEIILPSLKKGEILILDRFYDSTLAYQGYGRGIDKSLIIKLNRIVTEGITPNLTILLDKGLKSILRSGKDRFENEPISFYQRVKKGYLEIALSNKTRVKTISVRADKNETFQEIKKVVIPCLQKWHRVSF
ncbi:MAG: dTMP kinase [bacterium (Candidatus Ratteibacteria) CG_4_10_14_3_um_filter_41_18]|uniref:Thymidylate kinase n=4 Tax=Candidatus Ratteibacteria TaxID=2979319 RepID=A0A2M7YGK8_9BACT|nr:MAG: dTMP kinase [Candidatus Omnitrophica bacterium CG1_02_41_171]PIV64081.1 MAG: dTMP kinase [bacterium (Candidatus Ratteibacteria) CG01_land_8_20_14_3_00_40_19]PIW33552.1 MAG: dTMP kinase [bacterium (Candidatus Ratteibacteria) CG15_BIG_FIL_POST_REV_8_21_14_020_41_12]PIW73930.1 MAG: dTMP kinase [bacterium (Candidatus Ratteibacteria) CG_4_8_14_3_um_filter_41_36]PIX77012.1 MAG: dTMP kinase [bacterium (Candidatus Ratteibacteria) CG_4_10_14_3_um_filter_41_18]PJA62113.1 MAG: dTMP kinase [bacter